MKFGIFYEHQLPRPWTEHGEYGLMQNSLDQLELADRLGYDYAWKVEHHFLDEYSHSSAPEHHRAASLRSALSSSIRRARTRTKTSARVSKFLREKSCLNLMTASQHTRYGRRPSCPAICYSTHSAPRNILIGQRRFEKMQGVDRPSRIHSKRFQGIQS